MVYKEWQKIVKAYKEKPSATLSHLMVRRLMGMYPFDKKGEKNAKGKESINVCYHQ